MQGIVVQYIFKIQHIDQQL